MIHVFLFLQSSHWKSDTRLTSKVWYCLFCHFDRSTSNVNNLVMTLNQTKFDDKIIIIEFCIRKIVLTFLGMPYIFLGGGTAKSLTFCESGSEYLERGPQCLARWRNFQKPLRTIVVLRIGYNLTGRNDTSSQYPQCLNQKNGRFCPTQGGGGASRVSGRGVISFQGP